MTSDERAIQNITPIQYNFSIQIRRVTNMPFGSFAISGVVAAIVAIVFGIVILKWPKSIAYLVGIYLIVIGVLFFVQHYLL
jgi:multidrug transporter EmrE-like cation transporter